MQALTRPDLLQAPPGSDKARPQSPPLPITSGDMAGSLSRLMQARLKYLELRLTQCDDHGIRRIFQDGTVILLIQRLDGCSLSVAEQTVLIEMFNSADCLRDAQRDASQDAISAATGG